MKVNKFFTGFLICLNLVGVVCLIYFAVPYLTHNTQIPHPDAMLPAQRWDMAGMSLTMGTIPLFIANLLGFLLIRVKKNRLRILFFLPSAICIAIVAHYWITGAIM